MPVATNCWVAPVAIAGFAGVTTIRTRMAGVTVKSDTPFLLPKLAVMIALPLATPVAMPVALLTVATAGVPELQLEDAVTSRDAPSAKVAVATNCCVPPVGTEAIAGVTAIETRSAAGKPNTGPRP